MQNYIKIIFRGIGQVMLQNNAWTGLLFLLGIFYNSWLMGLGAILGTITSTLLAKILKYPHEDMENGLFGFNGALIGIAVWFFFAPSVITALAILIGAAFSTVLMQAMKKYIPAYTAPFVIVTWVIIWGIKFFGLASFMTTSSLGVNSFNLFSATTLGFGQVMFQDSIITGVIFILAIIINSRLSAAYAIYGSLLGGLSALLFSFPITMINAGLFGYSAILCGIALGTKKWSGFLFATIAIVLSVLLNYGMGKIGIATLTAPFILGVWIALLIKKTR